MFVRRVPIAFFFINLLLLTALRLAFWLAFRHTSAPLSSHDLGFAFYLGLKFDARLIAILTLPLLFLRRGASVYIAIVESLLLVLYAIDFGSYAYVGQRVNAGLIEFLRNPLISMHMVWESYHTGFLFLAIVVVIVAVILATRRTERVTTRHTAIIVIALLACIYGKFSRYPLRWSDAYFSRSRFAGDLALNPAQYLFETMREKPATLDIARLRRLFPVIASYLGLDPQRFDFRRVIEPRHPPLKQPNIVLIQLESFAAFKMAAFGNRMNATPNIDALARGGILFTRHYSTSEKTARALFAVMFGIPDVSSWQASAHNPLTVDQYSIANTFAGYDRLYFLGGSANWSNIRGMLEHNLDGLRVFEEGSYNAPVVDVWGISDEDLMLAANDVFRRDERPFFAIVQTSGNHRPYTIPKATHGFEVRHVPESMLRANGFESGEEFNGCRYLDHAIGVLMRAAQKEPYFANTIFVLYGDHGTRTGAPRSALALGDLSPVVYHVPLIVYAPGIIQTPQMIDTPSSHVDILPTIAGLCGVRYMDQTLGIDVLDPTFAPRSVAFFFTTFRDPPDVVVLDRAGEHTDDLARAFYESSRWLLTHNR